MIRQIGPPTFFVIFTPVEKLWDLVIKALHTLHAEKLNLLNKIKNFQFVHIT
jgi:hypothetical protein